MKKTIKLILLLCLVLSFCTLMFTSCDGKENACNTTDDTTDNGGSEEHVHAFGEWTVTKEATCTENGEKERACSCGEKEVLGIESLGHIKVVDPATAPTCTAEGKTEGEHCSTCGFVFVEQASIPVVDHTYDNDKDEKCNVCDFIRVVDCKHTKTETLKAVSATCTKDGLTEGKKCAKCGEILVAQKTVNKLGHKEVTDKAVDPTCTADGKTEGKHCSRCNVVLVAQTTVNKLGHIEVIDNALEPTCAKEGKTEGSHCSRCNTTLVAQKKIDKLTHTEVIDEAVAATCTTDGKTEGKHCSVCNVIIIEQSTISAFGHTTSDWIIDSLATCTVNGKRHKRCSTCGLNYNNEEYYEDHDSSTALTTSYWYYDGNEKMTWSQEYPFIAHVCKNCNYGYWLGPSPTLKYTSTSYLYDGIHYNFKATVANYGIGELKTRFIIADFNTAIEAWHRYSEYNTSYKFDYDSGWINYERYSFDCLNFNPIASYDMPYIFVIVYDPTTDTKQTYGAEINKETWTTDGSWFYYFIDLSLGSKP